MTRRSRIGTQVCKDIEKEELIDHLKRKDYVRRKSRGKILKKIL